jgi:hypothetical protein
LQTINLNNELDRRRQEKRVKPEQPVLRMKKAALENRFKGINKIQGGAKRRKKFTPYIAKGSVVP